MSLYVFTLIIKMYQLKAVKIFVIFFPGYIRDIFSAHVAPSKIEFGHVCENPTEWEQRFEEKDFKNNHHQGKVYFCY